LYGDLKSTAKARVLKSQKDWQPGRRKRSGLQRVSNPSQDVALVAEAQRNPFVSKKDHETDTSFPGQKNTLISRFKEAPLMARKFAGRSFSLTNINYTF